MISLIQVFTTACCCFPILTSARALAKYKRYADYKTKTSFIISYPSSTQVRLLPSISTTANSSQHLVINDSTTKPISHDSDSSSQNSPIINDSTTKPISHDSDSSSQNSPSNPLRISAIGELIEIERCYDKNLLIATNQFIKSLHNARVLNNYEIEQEYGYETSVICNLKNQILTLVIDISTNQMQRFPADDKAIMFTHIFAPFTNLQYCNFCPSLLDHQRLSFFTTPLTIISSNEEGR
ncbi:unnamed protein product [Rotaria magnacalcarata]|uniref:Uncharacterized protein n=1 Tax=Rotaria magnacalcarata TaxID=392030 RepID=A0A817AH20_9BILA|nr:unnamed protein product [Rotaria magnacalcarata]